MIEQTNGIAASSLLLFLPLVLDVILTLQKGLQGFETDIYGRRINIVGHDTGRGGGLLLPLVR